MTRDWRDDRIDEQAAIIAKLMAQVEMLVARVAKLEEQVRRSSHNSSQPPSSDGPAVPPRKKKSTGTRKPGGQAGHEKHVRPLVPQGEVDALVVLRPTRCRACHGALFGSDPAPHRHQVFELPRIVPRVTEYTLHSLDCACGARTRATLPHGVPTGAFGPSVVAMTGLLMGAYRLSKRAVAEIMHEVFGLHISLGAVVGCQELASEALVAPYQEARDFVVTEPVKYADETSWREARDTAWLWTVVTAHVTVFMVHARRNADAARELLGRACGVLVSDRHGGYNWWPATKRQFCWAHLVRDFVQIAERCAHSERIGDGLLAESDQMFSWWHRVRDGTLSRSTFRIYMRAVQKRVEGLLTEGADGPHSSTAKTCTNVLKHFDSLWTFLRVEGVEPTNNGAERAVRHAVLMRKTSGGTHSEQGSRFVERILTVRATLRQQSRDVLRFLHDACNAALHGATPPSLLPEHVLERSASLLSPRAHAA